MSDAAQPGDPPWEYPAGEGRGPASPDAGPHLALAGFDGPLAFLLEMAQRHRINLGQIELPSLIDQFVAAFAAATTQVPLAQRGGWLVMAATLLELKAQLLWPATPRDADAAQAEAARRLDALAALAHAQAAARWLAARRQLGMECFARGRGDHMPAPQAELYVAFLEATLVMLEGRPPLEDEERFSDRPLVRDLWRVQDALARMRRMLAENGAARPLDMFLPEIAAEASDRELRCRAAVASTFMAGLELTREGVAVVDRDKLPGVVLFATTYPDRDMTAGFVVKSDQKRQ